MTCFYVNKSQFKVIIVVIYFCLKHYNTFWNGKVCIANMQRMFDNYDLSERVVMGRREILKRGKISKNYFLENL